MSDHPPRPMPFAWRLGIAALVLLLGTIAYVLRDTLGPRVTAAMGILCFLGIPAALSSNLRAVNMRTLGWGIALQVLLAFLTLKVGWTRSYAPEEAELFQARHDIA